MEATRKTPSENLVEIYPQYAGGSGNGHFFEVMETMLGFRLMPFLSARSAMVSGLKALGLSRMDEILVPPFLSHCVLSALARVCFPTLRPSPRTRAVLVHHQYGFPQNMDAILPEAERRKWFILNDCATSLFTRVNGHSVIRWGTFSVVSFAKFFHCGLAGGLWTDRQVILESGLKKDPNDAEAAENLFEHYLRFFEERDPYRAGLIINAIYGCLPGIKTIPQKALAALPSTQKQVEADALKRKRLLKVALEMLGERVPQCQDDVVPFAIPVLGNPLELEILSKEIERRLSHHTPVLHFDTAMNLLAPAYKKALIIGCHKEWKEEVVLQIFRIIGQAGA